MLSKAVNEAMFMIPLLRSTKILVKRPVIACVDNVWAVLWQVIRLPLVRLNMLTSDLKMSMNMLKIDW